MFMRDRCLDFHFCQTRFKVIRINTQVMLRVEKKKENVGKARKLWVFICLFFVFVFFLTFKVIYFLLHTRTNFVLMPQKCSQKPSLL